MTIQSLVYISVYICISVDRLQPQRTTRYPPPASKIRGGSFIWVLTSFSHAALTQSAMAPLSLTSTASTDEATPHRDSPAPPTSTQRRHGHIDYVDRFAAIA